MRKLSVLLVASFLSACGVQPIANPINGTNLYQAKAAYDATALTALNAYARLPRCAPDTHISVSNLCHETSFLVVARGYDKKVEAAFASARIFQRDNPTLDASAQLALFQQAVSLAEDYIASHGIALAKS